jgi:NTE family protein
MQGRNYVRGICSQGEQAQQSNRLAYHAPDSNREFGPQPIDLSQMEAPTVNDRALVLGGGGLAGIAWTTGLLFGLSEQGVDLRHAGLVVGTSAGAAVAAQLSSPLSLAELFLRQVDPARQTREITPDPRLLELLVSAFPMTGRVADRAEFHRSIGRWALNAATVSEEERRAVIAERLPTHSWPDRALHIVAVNTATGEPEVFDRFSATHLVDAVSASCAVPGVWPPVTIRGHRYMDGGARSSDNADLAKGYARIVIVSPMGDRPVEIVAYPLREQIELLENAGATTYTVEPDEASRSAIGANPLLPETRRPSAEAGRRQALAIAPDIARFWE